MQILINKELEKILNEAAQSQHQTVDEMVNNILTFSLNTYIAVAQANKTLSVLETEVLPRLANIEVGNIAIRHQVTNFHADVLENSDRALMIAEEATNIGKKTVLEDTE
jgi:hypothetical protein